MSYGSGLLKGLSVTFKNMVTSYTKKRGDSGGVTTVQYPEERVTLPENYRQFPFLIYDGDDPEAGSRCTGCKICEQECPPGCIYIEVAKDEKGKSLGRPSVFDIDFAVCMSCSICSEVCPFESIRMSHEYERSEYGRNEELYYRMDRLLRPNSYYQSIKPIQAAEDDESIRLKKEKKAAVAKKRAEMKAKKEAEAKAKAEATPEADEKKAADDNPEPTEEKKSPDGGDA
jgi:NADH-quinone oxidoreductase subunit I